MKKKLIILTIIISFIFSGCSNNKYSDDFINEKSYYYGIIKEVTDDKAIIELEKIQINCNVYDYSKIAKGLNIKNKTYTINLNYDNVLKTNLNIGRDEFNKAKDNFIVNSYIRYPYDYPKAPYSLISKNRTNIQIPKTCKNFKNENYYFVCKDSNYCPKLDEISNYVKKENIIPNETRTVVVLKDNEYNEVSKQFELIPIFDGWGNRDEISILLKFDYEKLSKQNKCLVLDMNDSLEKYLKDNNIPYKAMSLMTYKFQINTNLEEIKNFIVYARNDACINGASFDFITNGSQEIFNKNWTTSVDTW